MPVPVAVGEAEAVGLAFGAAVTVGLGEGVGVLVGPGLGVGVGVGEGVGVGVAVAAPVVVPPVSPVSVCEPLLLSPLQPIKANPKTATIMMTNGASAFIFRPQEQSLWLCPRDQSVKSPRLTSLTRANRPVFTDALSPSPASGLWLGAPGKRPCVRVLVPQQAGS